MQSTEIRRYRVREVLGRGGFGTVYRADLEGLLGFERPVALKVLNADITGAPEVARRFRDEARVLGLVRHQSIVQVDGMALFDGRWAVVMEYIEGADLREILADGPVPVGVAIDIIREVCAALHAGFVACAPNGLPLGLLHRDIKPANIQLTPAGEVKLLDYGVARACFEERESETDHLCFGSPGYMAPERFEFFDSHSGDVYSAGAVLYELLVGEPLGETTNDVGRHQELMRRARKELRRVTDEEELIEVVLRSMSFAPHRRPSARELEHQLRELRSKFDDPWVSDWAATFVPRAKEKRRAEVDEFTGTLLTEDTLTKNGVPLERTEPRPPRRDGGVGTLLRWPALARIPSRRRQAFALLGASAGVGFGTALGLVLQLLAAR